MNYLVTEDRPLMELIDSKIVFANYLTGRYYGKDIEQLTPKPTKGSEIPDPPNERITLKHAEGRGGLLTQPGVLMMNKGPVLRGVWMLRRVLGEHIGEPPPDIPAITAVIADPKASFRERFELHRSNTACAAAMTRSIRSATPLRPTMTRAFSS